LKNGNTVARHHLGKAYHAVNFALFIAFNIRYHKNSEHNTQYKQTRKNLHDNELVSY
jgi:hypothetical protein